jgi:hypothetical protein
MKPYKQRVELILRSEWPRLSARPAVVADLAIRTVQDELVVPLVDENRDTRKLLYSGLAGRLVRMVLEAQRAAHHSCDPNRRASQDQCGACLLSRIAAEVWIKPTVVSPTV